MGTDVGGPETARAHESARVDHLFYYTAPDLLLHAFLPTMIKLQLTLTKQIFPRPKGQFWVEDSVVLAQNCLELENNTENALLLQHRPRTWNAKGYTHDGSVHSNSYSSYRKTVCVLR